MTDDALAGVTVLVTRPAAQAGELVAAVTARGGTAVAFPVIETEGRDDADIAAALRRLPAADIVIFVSTNAVRYGHAAAGRAAVAAIGPATALALAQHGLETTIRAPGGFTSEHLLAAPGLQRVAGKVVRIVRGNGGRDLLAETLRERGATVDYLEVYARRVPRYSAPEVAAMGRRIVAGEIDAVTIMSVDSLVNLLALLPATCHAALQKAILVTPALRVLKEVDERLPGTPAVLAQGPEAEQMVAAIVASTNPGNPDD